MNIYNLGRASSIFNRGGVVLPMFRGISICRNVKGGSFAHNDTTRRILTSVKEIKSLERREIVFRMIL
jgi:hypothetical protein